jgi:TolB-like protein
LEWEAQAVTAITSHDNTNFYMGLSSAKSNDITTQNVICFELIADALNGKVDAAGTETLTGTITATLTNWNKFKIVIEDTSVTFSVNEVDQTAIITNIPSVAQYIVFGTRSEAAAAVGLNIGGVRAWYEEVL